MKSVLIVDDNPTVRSALRNFLTKNTQMNICGEAGDGLEAIRQAEARKPDVILLDLCMPGMNGAEAASTLRSRHPKARIVIFSLYSDLMGKTMAKASGVDLVLSKSEGVGRLIEALEPLLS